MSAGVRPASRPAPSPGPRPGPHPGPRRLLRLRRPGPGAALALLAGLLLAVSLWSLSVGATTAGPGEMARAWLAGDGSRAHLVLERVRLPRLLTGLLAGATLAAAGAIMQAVTANPLASPGLLGVNAGAAFGVVIATTLFAGRATGFYIWWAFAGAAAAAGLVYALGGAGGRAGRGGATPLRLALAGAILSAFLGSLTASVLIFDKGTLDAVRIWTVGSVEGRSLADIAAVAPYAAAGLLGALVFRRQVATLALGAEIARQVGQNVTLWRLVCAALVVLTAGGAVALAGPIGFVGLVAPHAARLCAGADYGRILPAAALGGALLVVGADALLRAALPARDIPVGVGMALIGAPFFIALARGRVGGPA